MTNSRTREAGQDIREILDQLPSLIGHWGHDLRNRFGNQAYAAWFGIDPGTMHGRHIRELIGEERYQSNLPHIEAALRGEPQEFERTYSLPGQARERRALVNYIPDLRDGEVQGFFVLVTDVTAVKQAGSALQLAHLELQRRIEQLRQLAMEATNAEERERRAIAHELHDDLGQLLHVAKLKLDALAKRVPKAAAPLAGELDALLGCASRMVRSLTAQLSPPVLDDLGLVAALRWLAEEMDRLHGIDVATEVDCAVTAVAPEQAAIVFRTVRELLFNVAKHAGVAAARLAIRCSEGRLLVTVADSGVGIADIDATLVSRHGHGLASVRERIGFLGGSMAVSSVPGMGTSVTLTMPLQLAGEGA